MSVGDIKKAVITSYKADVSDHLKGLKRIEDGVDKLAKSEKEASKDREKAGAGWLAGLHNLGGAYDTVSGAIGKMMELQKYSANESRLAAAAMGADMAGLTRASHGLATQHTLLADAADMSNGMIKMSAGDMATAQKAMVAASRTGEDYAKSHDVIMDAVTNLRTKGLRDLGIIIDDTGLSMDKASDRTEIYNRIMKELAGSSVDVKDGQDAAGESVMQSSIKLEDAYSKIKKSLGDLATSMQPLLKALAEAVGVIAKIAGKASGGIGLFLDVGDLHDAKSDVASRLRLSKKFGKEFGENAATLRAGGLDDQAMRDLMQRQTELMADIAANSKLMAASQAFIDSKIRAGSASGVSGGSGIYVSDPWTSGSKGALGTEAQSPYGTITRLTDAELSNEAAKYAPKKRPTDPDYVDPYNLIVKLDPIDRALLANLTGQELASESRETYDPNGLIKRDDAITRAQTESADDLVRAQMESEDAAYQSTKTDASLEKMFGPIDSFDAYAAAFDMLTGASTAAFGAWIDGSMSAGQAIEKFMQQSLKSVAQQLLAEGIKEGVFALGSLAMGDMKGAALHGAASAKAFIGAGVVGAMAKVAYGGGGGAPAGGGGRSTGGSTGGNASGGSGGNTIVIVTGNDMANDTQRQRQIRARQYVSLGLGQAGYGMVNE